MSSSNSLTHDQTEPKTGLVVINLVVTFVILIVLVILSFIFYSGSISKIQDQHDDRYVSTGYAKFNDDQQVELNQLQYREGYIKLPIDLAKQSIIVRYSK